MYPLDLWGWGSKSMRLFTLVVSHQIVCKEQRLGFQYLSVFHNRLTEFLAYHILLISLLSSFYFESLFNIMISYLEILDHVDDCRDGDFDFVLVLEMMVWA